MLRCLGDHFRSGQELTTIGLGGEVTTDHLPLLTDCPIVLQRM